MTDHMIPVYAKIIAADCTRLPVLHVSRQRAVIVLALKWGTSLIHGINWCPTKQSAEMIVITDVDLASGHRHRKVKAHSIS